jgi:hypothetical protein
VHDMSYPPCARECFRLHTLYFLGLLTQKISFKIFTLIFMVSKPFNYSDFKCRILRKRCFEGYFHHQEMPGMEINDGKKFLLINYSYKYIYHVYLCIIIWFQCCFNCIKKLHSNNAFPVWWEISGTHQNFWN